MTTYIDGLIGRLRRTPAQRHTRFLEAMAATAEPALQRGGASSGGSDGDGDADDGNASTGTCSTCNGSGTSGGGLCPTCEGSGNQPLREAVALKTLTGAAVTKLREAAKTGAPVYEVELLAEGPSVTSGVFYTGQALREAAGSHIFEGMQAYAMHPRAGTPENAEPGNRDLRQLVGYYRNVRFTESGSQGKPALKAELVVNTGQGWFTHLLESAVAARGDGVQLCGISIDAEGYAEPGEVAGRRYELCRTITSASSADVVSKAAAGGTIVRRLRESVARTQLPKPQEAQTMKFAEFTPKLEAAHTKLRESLAGLTKDEASDQDVKDSLAGLAEAEGAIMSLREAEIEPEIREVEKLVPADETEKADLTTKLREAEAATATAIAERDTEREQRTAAERALTAARVLREAEIPTDKAGPLFDQLVKLDGEESMKAHLDGVKSYEENLFARFRESLGLGAPSSVEGAGALLPVGAPAGSSGADRLAEAGIPLTPESAAA